jgi:hypothetical protein
VSFSDFQAAVRDGRTSKFWDTMRGCNIACLYVGMAGMEEEGEERMSIDLNIFSISVTGGSLGTDNPGYCRFPKMSIQVREEERGD